MKDLVDRLRRSGCDFEPFTPGHKHCKCHLAHEAADEIERLRAQRDDAERRAKEWRNVVAINIDNSKQTTPF